MLLYQRSFIVVFTILTFLTIGSFGIKCYQCSSDTDPEGVDNCGAYTNFDKERHIPVECNSDESKMPGTFCVKLTQQSPRGFIWDGRWRQVIRRCASVANTGVTGVCNWGVYENGVYWQECSCSEDSCNSATNLGLAFSTILATLVISQYLM
ncbi:ATPase family AAA domain-containing protein 1-A-like precursor [Nasonia vitripennis]|uniref:Protein sleepless n=1 Tax=Nasonia vitripennis TaxID=7425 RepID=A0A7M6W5Z9_NASVI|nr:ATPase family AAA domain-containing protein 1-A-like precursor [Nasonia vitripennis]